MKAPFSTVLEKVAARMGHLNAAEVQAILSIGRTFLDEEVQRGKLVQLGRGKSRRFPAASVAEYMERKGGDARSPHRQEMVDEQKNGRLRVAASQPRKKTENA